MADDRLSELLDDAYPRCPRCLEQLDDVGAVLRPHLVCPHCGLAVMVPGQP